MNQTIQHLSEICDKYRFKEKLLFVPSYSVGHQVGENLAKAMGSWINLRMTTVARYAQALLEENLYSISKLIVCSKSARVYDD